MDFDTDVTDIRLPPIQIEELKKGLRSRGSLKVEQSVPDMQYSLGVSGQGVNVGFFPFLNLMFLCCLQRIFGTSTCCYKQLLSLCCG